MLYRINKLLVRWHWNYLFSRKLAKNEHVLFIDSKTGGIYLRLERETQAAEDISQIESLIRIKKIHGSLLPQITDA